MRLVDMVLMIALSVPTMAWGQTGDVAAGPKPVIYCAQPKFDFGNLIQGKSVEHTFVLQNKGDATLKIMSVNPSCGCTAALVSQNAVEPGQTSEIKAKFDSGRFRGPVHKTISVSSNDPASPQITLELTGTVVRLYETVPDGGVSFGDVNKSSSFETQVTVRGMEGRKPVVSSVAVENDSSFDATFAKKPNSDEYLVTLRLKPESQPHRVTGNLVINLNDPDNPKLVVPLIGQIVGDLVFFPPQINFGRLKPLDNMRGKVLVTIYNPAVKVEAVETEPPVFVATVSSGTKPRTEITIQIKEGAPAGDVKGTVKIHTTSKEQPLITIPLSGTIVAQ
ncbi:MAG: DUF1573 domain-containing protein [Acidobacteriota bacterium]